MRRRNEMTDGPWSRYERAPECLSGPDSLAKTSGFDLPAKGYQCDETSPLKSLGHLLAQSPDPRFPHGPAEVCGLDSVSQEGSSILGNGRVLKGHKRGGRGLEKDAYEAAAVAVIAGGQDLTERRPSEASEGRLAAATAGESGPPNPRTLQDAGAEAQCSSVWDARDEIGETSSRRGASEDSVMGGGAALQRTAVPQSRQGQRLQAPSSPAVKVSSRLSLRTAAGLWSLESNRTWTGKGTGQGPQRLQTGPGAVRGKARQGKARQGRQAGLGWSK
ncbi:hypothetical protein CSOJ01_07183 [Colletotrichum sojae]|uniref:Uncharacterized protein n=1 Tax=Colletotrichum sojae TaxID=2175907 RepID=A0A8H6MU27_9PEZI|nr:hypothetical protein CSOJ01_07183 [Colletotrichum sojae]